jgi:hypothetical protein
MRSSDFELFWNLATKDYAFATLVLSLLGFVFGAFWGLSAPMILIYSLLSFTAFDAIGYESVAHSENRMDLVRYRICQTTYQWFLAIFASSLSNGLFWVVFGYIILWWIGLCDVIFYYLLKKEKDLYSYGNMPWVWWTPLGMINRILGRDTTGKELATMSFASLIIWFILWFFVPSMKYLTIYDLFH